MQSLVREFQSNLPPFFTSPPFPKTLKYLLQIKIQRCLQKEWGVSYDMSCLLWKIYFGYWTTVSEVDLHPVQNCGNRIAVTELCRGSLTCTAQKCIIMVMNAILFMVMYPK